MSKVQEGRSVSASERISVRPGIDEENLEGIFELALEDLTYLFVGNELISWDPHFHTQFSDGEGVHVMYQFMEAMDKKGSPADHSRESTEAIVFYDSNGKEAYGITSEGEISHKEYIDQLRDSISDEERDRESKVSKEEIENIYRDISENSSEEEIEAEIDSFLEEDEFIEVIPSIPERRKGRMNPSIEKDYESRIDNGIESFLDENDLGHAVISVHNMPRKFIQDNMQSDQTQYLRKADLDHLSEDELIKAVDRYQAEYMRAILETNDLSDLGSQEKTRWSSFITNTLEDTTLTNISKTISLLELK
jgi:hypothetical protein